VGSVPSTSLVGLYVPPNLAGGSSLSGPSGPGKRYLLLLSQSMYVIMYFRRSQKNLCCGGGFGNIRRDCIHASVQYSFVGGSLSPYSQEVRILCNYGINVGAVKVKSECSNSGLRGNRDGGRER
jgi:hypothetical protein